MASAAVYSTLLLFLLAVTNGGRVAENFPNKVIGKADEACTSIGGTCLDWRNYKCTAGYLTGKCSGDTNIRCCQRCDATCQNNEAAWSAGDSVCTQATGVCMDNSNYCDGVYTSGKCGGPNNRQCCQKQEAAGRTMTTKGYNLIKGFEGLSLTAYQDVAGIWTIGYGNTRYEDGTPVRQGDVITQARADSLFAYFVDQDFAPAVDRLVGTGVVLTQQQFEALVSFTYNVGTGAFSTSTLLSKVRVNPNDPTIRDEFMKWVYSGGQVVQGLVNRREKEADYYFGLI